MVRKQRHLTIGLLVFAVMLCLITGCGKKEEALSDGTYTVDIAMEGGSGRASIESPAALEVKDGEMFATIIWSSSNYDYMIVDEEKYLNENEDVDGNSTFTIPVSALDTEITVIGNTTAMSTPHEIEYTLTFTLTEADFSELKKTGDVEIAYSTQLQIEKYGIYSLVTIVSDGRYLLVPKTAQVPVNIPEDVTVIRTPIEKGYLAATSAMDLINEIGALSSLRFSGTKADGWYIEDAREAMEKEELLYAGKYNIPDYEQLLSESCDLAIESTMIYHNPEVKDKLIDLGIPVLVERSSYENHPLGRLEWIKLYGALFDKEEEAEEFYKEQLQKVESLLNEEESTGCSASFFYVTSNGSINVRKPNDYITQMIDIAGGEYILADLEVSDDSAMSTMKMQMEDFYAGAKDADVIIYNSTIDGEIESIEDLIELNALFEDFKAVKEDRVYCTSSNFFQETTGTCDFIEDLHLVFTDPKADEFTYLKKLG